MRKSLKMFIIIYDFDGEFFEHDNLWLLNLFLLRVNFEANRNIEFKSRRARAMSPINKF